MPYAKLAIFCCQSSFLTEDGVRVTCQAKTRYKNYFLHITQEWFEQKYKVDKTMRDVFFSKQVYTNLEGNRANLVQTSWALMSLIDAGQVSRQISSYASAIEFNFVACYCAKSDFFCWEKGWDRSNSSRAWNKVIDQFTDGRWRLPPTGEK